jgi:hypothetical protein
MPTENATPSLRRWWQMLLRYCRAALIQTKRTFLAVRRKTSRSHRHPSSQTIRQTDLTPQKQTRSVFSRLSRAVNRRTLAFGFASVTGAVALALLLVPSWQAMNWGSFFTETKPETSQAEKSGAPSGPSKVEPENVSVNIPNEVPSPFETEQNTEPPVTSASPFESSNEPPQFETKPAEEKIVNSGAIKQPPIDLNNPFPLPSTVEKNDSDLSVKLSRIPNKLAMDQQFLVTSLSTTQVPIIPVGKMENIFASQKKPYSGWRTMGTLKNTGEVVPTKYRAATSSLSVPITATISTHWIVSSPKLHCEIETPNSVVVNGKIPIRIRVTNTGTAKAENVVLHVDLPKSLKYHVGQSLTHSIGTLEPGKTHVARLTPRSVVAGSAKIKVRTFADGDVSSSQEKQIRLLSR